MTRIPAREFTKFPRLSSRLQNGRLFTHTTTNALPELLLPSSICEFIQKSWVIPRTPIAEGGDPSRNGGPRCDPDFRLRSYQSVHFTYLLTSELKRFMSDVICAQFRLLANPWLGSRTGRIASSKDTELSEHYGHYNDLASWQPTNSRVSVGRGLSLSACCYQFGDFTCTVLWMITEK